jgi:hypothetical protein
MLTSTNRTIAYDRTNYGKDTLVKIDKSKFLLCISTSYPDTYRLLTNCPAPTMPPWITNFKNNPLWMPEIGLGIGNDRASYGGVTRDWLYWYDENGQRYPTPQEQIEQMRQRADSAEIRAEDADRLIEQERQRADRLAAQLRALGIEPD